MKRFLKVLFIIFTVLSATFYLLSCLTPFISPEHFWPFTFLALGFPYTALGYSLLILMWLFIKRRTALYLFIILLVGVPNISSTVAFNFGSSGITPKEKLRVLGWNVRFFDNAAVHADSPNAVRRRMFNYLKEVNADVLCLQEFHEYEGPSYLSNIQELANMGYKYYYYPSETPNPSSGSLVRGSVIFSKLPILNTGLQVYNDSSYKEVIAHADIQFNSQVIRFISTHFRSYNLRIVNYDPAARGAPLHYDSTFIFEATTFEKLKAFDKEHSIDARIAQRVIEQSPHPVIFSSDLNSVPASYTYHTVSKNMQDAFLQKGKGLGGSMDSLASILRIDVLLASKNFKVYNYKQDRLSLSDHYPHYIDVVLKH